jgi:hypothetical protein
MDEELDKEVETIVTIGKKEMEEFKKLSSETLEAIEKTEEELRIEEKLKLNLNFIHFRLKRIGQELKNITVLDVRMENGEPVENDLRLEVKGVIKDIFELEDQFFPGIENNIKFLLTMEGAANLADRLKKKLANYRKLTDKLKKLFKLHKYTNDELGRLAKADVSRLTPNLQ